MQPSADDQQLMLQQVIEFDLLPSHYLNDQWLEGDELQPVYVALSNHSVRSHFHLSQYLIKRFSLNTDAFQDFTQPVSRIALASSDEIERLEFYVGIVLNAAAIRAVVMKQEYRALNNCLGEAAFNFARRRAAYMVSPNAHLGPPMLIPWDNLESFKQQLAVCGRRVLFDAFAHFDDGFINRLRLKMSPQWTQINAEAPSQLTVEQSQSLLIKTHKEVNPRWRYLLS